MLLLTSWRWRRCHTDDIDVMTRGRRLAWYHCCLRYYDGYIERHGLLDDYIVIITAVTGFNGTLLLKILRQCYGITPPLPRRGARGIRECQYGAKKSHSAFDYVKRWRLYQYDDGGVTRARHHY